MRTSWGRGSGTRPKLCLVPQLPAPLKRDSSGICASPTDASFLHQEGALGKLGFCPPRPQRTETYTLQSPLATSPTPSAAEPLGRPVWDAAEGKGHPATPQSPESRRQKLPSPAQAELCRPPARRSPHRHPACKGRGTPRCRCGRSRRVTPPAARGGCRVGVGTTGRTRSPEGPLP